MVRLSSISLDQKKEVFYTSYIKKDDRREPGTNQEVVNSVLAEIKTVPPSRYPNIFQRRNGKVFFSSIITADHHSASMSKPKPKHSSDKQGNSQDGQSHVYLTSRSFVEDYEVVEDFGTIGASHMESVAFITDVYLAIKGFFGGELVQYSELHDTCCAHAVAKLQAMAIEKGGNAVVNLKIQPSMVMNRMIVGLNVSVVAYGTVLKLGSKRKR